MINCEDYCKYEYHLELAFQLCNKEIFNKFKNRIIMDTNGNMNEHITTWDAVRDHRFACDKPHNIEILSDDGKNILLDGKLVENWADDEGLRARLQND